MFAFNTCRQKESKESKLYNFLKFMNSGNSIKKENMVKSGNYVSLNSSSSRSSSFESGRAHKQEN